MSQSSRRWIIRDAQGRIEGPFTTEKVLYKIGRGEFSGDESVAHYPDDKWIPISQDPQFYDRLLEVLAQSPRQAEDEDTHVFEFTQPEPILPKDPQPEPPQEPADLDVESEPRPDFNKTPVREPQIDEPPSSARRVKKKRRRERRPEDIELVDVRPEVLKLAIRRARLPLFVAVLGLSVAALFWVTTAPREERLHLVAPQKNIPQVATESLKGRVRQGANAFLRDTLDGYVRAQNDFVYIVERNNKDTEVMGLLCMTYMQLWPYAYQDSVDAKAITTVLQMASSQDPGGPHSSTCRAVDLIIRARFQEAKSLVESVLEQHANETNPPILFYFLKGDLLETANEHSSAVDYLRSVQQLWPQWQLPYVVEGRALTKVERYPEAARAYQKVLRAVPEHTPARIELGLLEYKYFHHADLGEKYLRQALDGEDAPKPVLSRGYFGLAEIALLKGDQKRALKMAQKSYSLNSSNAAAKNLIVQLGGVQKLRGLKIKGQQLMFEGQQFENEGDYHAAQAHYKAAFEEDPKNAMAAMKAAQCLWKLSFSTEAIDWLNKAIRADAKLIEAYVTLADYHAQRFNFVTAVRVLEQAKRVNPKSNEVFRGFAMVELRRGNPKGAVSFGKRALELYENDVETLIVLARASLAERDPKMAYNYAAKGIEIDVNNRQAQIVYAQALAALQGIDVGVSYFLRLVNNYPLVTDYRIALGKMLMADERYQQAEEIFRQITRLEDKPKEAYVELAKVLKARGEAGEALELLLKAAVLDPADAEPLYLAGLIYLEQKKPQDASVQFKRVLTINKLYPLVNYHLGRAALQMGDPKGALSYTELEKQANPNLPEAYLLAAEAYTVIQQYTLCAQEYMRAIKLQPQSAMTYVKLAICDRKAGQVDAAMAMLNVASNKENGLADIYKELGAIYELKGDLNHAIEAYQQYFALDPEAPDRQQIEDHIMSLQRGR